jgi:hypothetical protein
MEDTVSLKEMTNCFLKAILGAMAVTTGAMREATERTDELAGKQTRIRKRLDFTAIK